MLALELRKLEKAGIVRRTSYAGYPLRVEYDLTPAGRQLVPLVDAIGGQPVASREYVFAPELVLRGSTGPARQGVTAGRQPSVVPTSMPIA